MSHPARIAIGLLVLIGAATLGCQRPTASAPVEPQSDDQQLCQRIDRALDFASARRHMSTDDQAAWQVVHGILAFGRNLEIYHDGQLVSALDYLLAGGQLRGWNLRKGDHGLEAILEAGSKIGQGHEDQWLGYLSLCGVDIDQKIIVGGQTYTVRDLLTQGQWDIYDGMEATWTLMACAKFLPLDAQWTAKDGTAWSTPRIVGMEAVQDLNESACGGTHRLVGLTVARDRFLAEGGKLAADGNGPWELADRQITHSIRLAREYQQPDGSLSANYFVRPSSSSDIATRLGTTGHTLEFLMLAMNDDEVNEPWVRRAVVNLVGCFEKTEKFDLECGALYHAARGLALYRQRRFGPRETSVPHDPTPTAQAAGAGQ